MTTYTHHFSLNNLPYGIASSALSPKQCVTRLNDTIIFLGVLQDSGFFDEIPDLKEGVFNESTLNTYAALEKSVHREVRRILQSTLGAEGRIESLPVGSTAHVRDVEMGIPVEVTGFTDFSTNIHHIRNAGLAILNNPTPPPGFYHFPIGYTGRASSIVLSGTPVTRPWGHIYDTVPSPTSNKEREGGGEGEGGDAKQEKKVIYAPSRALDYELELGFVIGKPVQPGEGVDAKDADGNVFGVVVVNDWSARDIQSVEMVPLGPLNSKSFATSISPWIVTLDALSPFRRATPSPQAVLPAHLADPGDGNYDIELKVELLHGTERSLLSSVRADMFWSGRQMVAHLASSGCGLRTGEVLGTGTVSGALREEMGCLLEITGGGKEGVRLSDGGERVFLLDGDVVVMSAVAGEGVEFGECVGEIRPAR